MKIVRQWVAISAALALSNITAAQQDNAPRLKMNIESQPITAALEKFADQTGLQVVFRDESGSMDGLKVPRISGELTAHEALNQLLANTSLKYEFVNPRTVRIVHAAVVPKSSDAGYGKKNELRLAQAERLPGEAGVGGTLETEKEGISENRLEEIIVTAQRREQNLQDVPISITVLSGETLDRSTGDGVLDAIDRVPGVAVTPFSNVGSVVTMRGVAPAFPSFFTASPIGYYIDSAPFGFLRAAFVPDMSAYDLERVEVLRGPQGTLYGASSVGGLVRILSKDADLDSTEFKVRTSLSGTRYGGANYGGDAAVNVPIVDGVVGARLVAGYHDLSGWIDQPNTGRKDANDGLNKTIRFKLNAQPTDALSLEFSTWFSRNEDGAPTIGNDSRQYQTGIDETLHSDFDLYAFELGYEFGAFSFSSATSHMSYEFIAETGNTLPPPLATYFTNRQLADVFSQEFQLASTTDGPWRWTAGAIYREVKERIFQNNIDSAGAQTGGYFAPTDITTFSDSYAVFGEITRTFFDGHVELTGGLRYFHDNTHGREDSNSTGSPPVGESRTRAFEKVSPRLVLSWLPSEHLTAYASYSEGYRSGFDQSPIAIFIDPTLPAADPDNLRNYEVGFKGDILDGRLSFDVATYYMDWQDVQAATLVTINGNFHSVVFNASSASGPGIDFSLVARPADRLTLGASVGWNDLTFDEVVNSPFGTVYNKGDRLSLSPEYTGSVWLDYTVPVSGGGHELRFSASGNYMSERYLRLLTQPGSTFQNEPLMTVAARVTLETPDHWSFALFADNLTNEQTPITGFDPAGYTGREDQQQRMRPRTVGIQMEYRFGK